MSLRGSYESRRFLSFFFEESEKSFFGGLFRRTFLFLMIEPAVVVVELFFTWCRWWVVSLRTFCVILRGSVDESFLQDVLFERLISVFAMDT